uniref:Reverse transcriptase RNase H-like domain-containing protein n=1 Tax=Cajanus cajan TaxID=3821 RepID=A0A151R9L0_CAJCA|nr:hypothetical protein KK1_039373 [Cajanus cajan]
MKNESVYVREMYAIIEAVKKWRQYLLGHKFKIITDSKVFNISSLRTSTPRSNKNGFRNYSGLILK